MKIIVNEECYQDNNQVLTAEQRQQIQKCATEFLSYHASLEISIEPNQEVSLERIEEIAQIFATPLRNKTTSLSKIKINMTEKEEKVFIKHLSAITFNWDSCYGVLNLDMSLSAANDLMQQNQFNFLVHINPNDRYLDLALLDKMLKIVKEGLILIDIPRCPEEYKKQFLDLSIYPTKSTLNSINGKNLAEITANISNYIKYYPGAVEYVSRCIDQYWKKLDLISKFADAKPETQKQFINICNAVTTLDETINLFKLLKDEILNSEQVSQAMLKKGLLKSSLDNLHQALSVNNLKSLEINFEKGHKDDQIEIMEIAASAAYKTNQQLCEQQEIWEFLQTSANYAAFQKFLDTRGLEEIKKNKTTLANDISGALDLKMDTNAIKYYLAQIRDVELESKEISSYIPKSIKEKKFQDPSAYKSMAHIIVLTQKIVNRWLNENDDGCQWPNDNLFKGAFVRKVAHEIFEAQKSDKFNNSIEQNAEQLYKIIQETPKSLFKDIEEALREPIDKTDFENTQQSTVMQIEENKNNFDKHPPVEKTKANDLLGHPNADYKLDEADKNAVFFDCNYTSDASGENDVFFDCE